MPKGAHCTLHLLDSVLFYLLYFFVNMVEKRKLSFKNFIYYWYQVKHFPTYLFIMSISSGPFLLLTIEILNVILLKNSFV